MVDKLLEWQNMAVASAALFTGLLTYFGWGFVADRIKDKDARKNRARAKAGRLAVRGVVLWLADRGMKEDESRKITLGQMMDFSANEQFKWPPIQEKTNGKTG